MATFSKDYLLDLFSPNNTQEITASDLQEYVNILYDEFVHKNYVVDNLNSVSPENPLSANQGKILN
jgi:hypothetical protein